jgi:polyisoprenoid-binding protein YceI
MEISEFPNLEYLCYKKKFLIKLIAMTRILVTSLTTFFMVAAFAQDAYKLSEESKLSIDGTSTVHDWTVTANTMSGTIRTKGNSPKEINFDVTVADILSERGATMDKKMHAALQKESHPKVLFALKEVKNESTLTGILTIAGKPKEVEISGDIESSGDNLKISGQYGIALKDFDIEPPTAMFGQVIVGDDVTVNFDLVFVKK